MATTYVVGIGVRECFHLGLVPVNSKVRLTATRIFVKIVTQIPSQICIKRGTQGCDIELKNTKTGNSTDDYTHTHSHTHTTHTHTKMQMQILLLPLGGYALR